MTNFEKIKAMTVEEMAKYIIAIAQKRWIGACCKCRFKTCDRCSVKSALIYLLKKEVKE